MDQKSPNWCTRVVSVPAGHPYVKSLGIDGDGVLRPPDPLPDPAEPTRWWPPVVLDASWIRANADTFDVLHVHFGTESLPPGRLAAALDALAEVGRPLVHTVHDLTNPQLTDQAAHEADLALLLARADAVITLTDGAAAEIERRWGRTAVVVPHPAIVAVDAATPRGRPSEAITVGVHLRDLRPGIDGVGAVRTLLAGLDALRDAGVVAVGRVVVNDRVREPAILAEITTLVTGRDDVALEVRARVSDADLEAEVADLDVALLPYRHGTHSGWVELCHDLGVGVVGPVAGQWHRQHPEEFVPLTMGDGASCAAAVVDAVAGGARPGSAERRDLVARRAAARAVERVAVARAHAAVYAGVLAPSGARA
ncbi:hypothetical protein C8046_03785 [Serinibacter arcticus]|uniref:Glycosyltransferase subfamily 4-like N-terminal domain-containing protein n=1 Tax=Serinibacter arcticus TaxID=1655435 RepID=A0A2U1ZSH0_9MICO|nr:glycosyltransferase [Serinibacter arcticus]PWD49934.1 hypothetical protein C8046_03785 [Serinibacter arcticus]